MLANLTIEYRKATKDDAKIIYNWANESIVREASFYSEPISWEKHLIWFNKKLYDENTLILIFQHENVPVGIVRIEKTNEIIIGISIDKKFRGKKLAPVILKMACAEFWKKTNDPILAFIKKNNATSVKSFDSAGFSFYKNDIVNGKDCFVYIKKNK